MQIRFAKNDADRQIRAYCVSPPKTGTKTLAHLFSMNHYRSAHEPLAYDFMPRFFSLRGISSTRNDLRNYLLARDNYLGLEFESSHFLWTNALEMADLWPDARFLLTTRDCYSWLESVINQHHSTYKLHRLSYWRKWYRYFVDSSGAPVDSSQPLLSRQNRSKILNYLRYLQLHIDTVLQIEQSRLMVLPLSELDSKVIKIGQFVGLSQRLTPIQAKNVRATKSLRFIASEADELTLLAEQYCGAFMNDFYPHIRHASEVLDTRTQSK